MGRPSRTRLQSLRLCSCWGPSLPWLLQPQRLKLQLMLMPGTVATATVDTVDTVATMATEKGLQVLSQSPLLQLPLTPTLMLMPGTVATATVDMVDTVATDTVDTVDTVATMATERGLQMPSLQPSLQLML